MVLLKAYHCHNCSSICEASGDFGVGICVECGKLTCGPCRKLFKDAKATTCRDSEKDCVYTSYYTGFFNYLQKFPPDDELKLLNYGKWSPVWCKCAADFATQRIGYVGGSSIRCTKCRPTDRAVKEPPIGTYMSIIDELRGYFSAQDCIATKRKGIQLTHFKCETCKTRLQYPVYLTITGDLICQKCKETSTACYPVRSRNIYFLYILLEYIPDIDDLKLLTYSKWTPLRCELCSSLFSTNVLQLPMFHRGCSKLLCNQCNYKHTCNKPNSTSLQLTWVLDVDKKFRSYFKNGGYDSSEPDIDQNLADPICYLPSNNSEQRMSIIPGFPKEVRCEECALFVAPNDLRRCVDCEKSCLCFACLTKKHWGHKIEEIATTLQTAFIQKESEKTLRKLAKWAVSLTEGNKQIDVVSMKVVDNYNWLYSAAVRESDLGLLQAIREWGDIGQLKDSVGEFTVAQIKFRHNVEMLAESLDNIVKAAKERYGGESNADVPEAATSELSKENTPIVDCKQI